MLDDEDVVVVMVEVGAGVVTVDVVEGMMVSAASVMISAAFRLAVLSSWAGAEAEAEAEAEEP